MGRFAENDTDLPPDVADATRDAPSLSAATFASPVEVPYERDKTFIIISGSTLARRSNVRWRREIRRGDDPAALLLGPVARCRLLGPPMPSPAPDPCHDLALRYLFGRINYERTAGVPYRAGGMKLDRMRELLRRLGDPQRQLKIVHVAGTKGKGSTATMIASILSNAGYRTGLYTSPHLERLEERIQIDSTACGPQDIVRLVEQVRPAADAMDRRGAARGAAPQGPTFFELTTAMALLHFAQSGVDAAVLEVGLGGRLDSTNVCQPLVSVITSISFDHMRQLGSTLEAIAAEKAGIIKPGVSVVNGAVQDEVSCVIEGIAREQRAPLYSLGRDFEYRYLGSGNGRGGVDGDGFSARRAIPDARDPADSRGSELIVEGGSGLPCQFGRMDYRGVLAGRTQQFDELAVGLLGRHQVANAAVALASLSCLAPHGFRIEEPAIRAGLGQLRCPARIEVVCRRPTVIVDVAHNAASVAALTAVLDESFAAPRRVLVMAASKEKDVRGMLEHLLPRFQHVVFTRYVNNPRSVDPHNLARLALPLVEARSPRAPAPGDIVVCPTPSEAWQHVQEIVAADDVIVLTGSFFLAAEMRALAQVPLTLPTSPAVHVA